MTSIFRISVLLLLAAMSQVAHARGIPPCQIWYTEFAPAHPSSSDTVNLMAHLPYSVGYAMTSNTVMLSKSEFLTPTSIAIDIVVTERPDQFQGYRLVNDRHWVDTAFAYLGPLEVGEYQVSTDVRVPDGSGGYTSLCAPDVRTLHVATESFPVALVRVVEFYNEALDHYFITQDAKEIADLDTGVHRGWSRTGESFLAYASYESDNRGRHVCRWYGLPSAGLDTHFMSALSAECYPSAATALGSGNWEREAESAFDIPLPDTSTGECPQTAVPVYRLWNARKDSNHRYRLC